MQRLDGGFQSESRGKKREIKNKIKTENKVTLQLDNCSFTSAVKNVRRQQTGCRRMIEI